METQAEEGVASAGVRCFHPYAMRHTAASLRIAAGENVVGVAKQMGHDPTMCLKVYAHIFEAYDDRRADSISRRYERQEERAEGFRRLAQDDPPAFTGGLRCYSEA